MCDDPHLEDDRYFSLTLKEDYKYYTVIFARISFLTEHVSSCFVLTCNFWKKISQSD
uniref:Uncharacterized protein n=1 Tax=Aegilops tauschii subsp. strangulata TaxID=200361 RepID=A0A452Y5G1_AEGTS